MSNLRYPHIDAWRFVAIAMVIVWHLAGYSHPWYRDVVPGLVWRIEGLGMLGVQIFFCISGYVICLGLVREQNRFGNVSMAGFYWRRACRILPPLLLYFGVVAALVWAGLILVPVEQYFQALAFLCNITIYPQCAWHVGHTWSLAYEEQFYLVFPSLFVWLALSSNRNRILIIMAVIYLFNLVAYSTSSTPLSLATQHLLCMCTGCACALYREELSSVIEGLSIKVWLGAVTIMFCTCFFVWPKLVYFFVLPIIKPLVISIAVIGTPMRNKIVQKLFSFAAIVYLGQISYTIYLWQQLVTPNYGFASPLVAICLIPVVCIFAHYSFQFFELPFIRFGAKKALRLDITPAELGRDVRIG